MDNKKDGTAVAEKNDENALTVSSDTKGSDAFKELYIVRGIGYAVTSMLAFLAGLFVGNGFTLGTMLFCLMLWFASIVFFIAYALRHQYDGQGEPNSIVKVLSWVVSILLAIFAGGIVYFTMHDLFISVGLIIAPYILALSILIFYYYRLNKTMRKEKKIREWLVIPVMFSIGMSFYTSFVISKIYTGVFVTVFPYFPFSLFLIYFAIVILSNKKSLKTYIIISFSFTAIALVVFLIILFIRMPALVELEESLKIAFMGVLLSAFMASYEAWRITKYVNNRDVSSHSFSGKISEYPYFKATSIAMVISILLLPIMLITEYFYTLFYTVVIIIGIFSCYYWLVSGLNNDRFQKKNWGLRKNIIGYIILTIVAIDSFFRISIPNILLAFNEFFQFSTLFVVIGIFFYLWNSLSNNYTRYQNIIISGGSNYSDLDNKGKFKLILSHMTNDPRNYNRVLGILSFLPFIVLFIIDISGANSMPGTLLRIRAAETIYIVISLICIVFDIIQKPFDFRKDDELMVPPQEEQNRNATQMIAGFIRLTRIPTCFFILLIVAVPYLFQPQAISLSVFKGLPFMLTAMAGFSINDIFDYRKDRTNKPHRAIPSGLVTMTQAKIIVVVLTVLAIILSLYVSENTTQLVLYSTALLGVFVYNLIIKHAALMKTVVTAFICVLPILFVATQLEQSSASIILSAIGFLYITGRELRMDILDYDGDKLAGDATFPVLFGKYKAAIISDILIYFSVILLCCLTLVVGKSTIGLCVVISIIFAQLVCEFLWRTTSKQLNKISILFQWVPMLISSLYFLNH